MNIYILDDKITAVNNIKSLLNFLKTNEQMDIEIEGFSIDADTAYKEILLLRPDVLFLDVELYNETAFEFLDRFSDRFFEVIIITAYDAYALDAYKYFALNYIQKPIDILQLKKALLQAETFSKQKKLINSNPVIDCIVVVNKETRTKILFDEIIYIGGEGSYTYFVLVDKRVIVASRGMYQYEPSLPTDAFFKIHKQFIVNKTQIIHYQSNNGGEVVMTNKKILPIAARRKKEFLEFFK